MRSIQKHCGGFTLIEAVVALAILLIAIVGGLACVLYIRRAIIEINARTEWRMMNFNLDTVLSDTLLCEKTNLVKSGDPNQYNGDKTLAPPNSDWTPALYKDVNTGTPADGAILFYPTPASTPVVLAKIGGGHSFEISSIRIGQYAPPTSEYAVGATLRSVVAASIVLEGYFRDRKSAAPPLNYTHRINFDVDTTGGGPGPFPATSCYAMASRRRSCEQFGMIYDPATAGPLSSICK